MSLSVMLECYLDSGETRIIKIRIAKKNTENLKNRNVLYTHKFLALRYIRVSTQKNEVFQNFSKLW